MLCSQMHCNAGLVCSCYLSLERGTPVLHCFVCSKLYQLQSVEINCSFIAFHSSVGLLLAFVFCIISSGQED